MRIQPPLLTYGSEWLKNGELLFLHDITAILLKEKYEDTKGVIISRKSNMDTQYKGQKNKQRSTKHYTENWFKQHEPGADPGGGAHPAP